MTLVSILVILFFGLVIFLIFRIVTRKKNPHRLALRDIGTIIDRTIWAYRQHLLPLLVISAFCVPLGNVSSYGLSFLSNYLVLFVYNPWAGGGFDRALAESWASTSAFLGGIALFTSFGVGKTLLTYKVATTIQAHATRDAFHLDQYLAGQRWDKLLGLVAIMVIPWLLFTFLGLIGAAVWLWFALAPIVFVYESLAPFAAAKRSYQLVRTQWSGLLNTLVPLWFIGWLIIGVPILASLLLLQWFTPVSPDLLAQLYLLGWLVGSVFIAPLVALGSLTFYLYLRERESAQQAVAATTLHQDFALRTPAESGQG